MLSGSLLRSGCSEYPPAGARARTCILYIACALKAHELLNILNFDNASAHIHTGANATRSSDCILFAAYQMQSPGLLCERY